MSPLSVLLALVAIVLAGLGVNAARWYLIDRRLRRAIRRARSRYTGGAS